MFFVFRAFFDFLIILLMVGVLFVGYTGLVIVVI